MGLYFWFVVCCLLSQLGESMRQLFVCRDSQHCPRLQPWQRLSPPTPPPTSAAAPPSKTLLHCSVCVTATKRCTWPFCKHFGDRKIYMEKTVTVVVEEYINYCRFASLLLRILYCRLFTAFSQLYINKYQRSLISTFLFLTISTNKAKAFCRTWCLYIKGLWTLKHPLLHLTFLCWAAVWKLSSHFHILLLTLAKQTDNHSWPHTSRDSGLTPLLTKVQQNATLPSLQKEERGIKATGRGDEKPREVDSDKWCGKKQQAAFWGGDE